MSAPPPLPDRDAALRWLEEALGLPCDDPHNGPWVPPDRVVEVARRLRDRGLRFFVLCAAAHYPAREDDPEHFVVAWRLRRTGPGGFEVGFRCRVPVDGEVPSLAGVFPGADWAEREQWDLVGVRFAGHPDLRRIMLPEDWEGHPLRRDVPIDTPHPPWR